MANLYNVDSPINREQRNNINATFLDIQRSFTSVRQQISILSGGADLEAIIQRIEDTITNAENTTADTQQVLDDISDALAQLQTALNNSNTASDNANNAATNAQTAITNMQNLVNQLGNAESYSNTKTYLKNNIVEFNGSGFIALQQTTGNEPPNIAVSKNNAYWQLIAQRGVDGAGSVSSVNGIPPQASGDVVLTPGDIGAATEQELENKLSNIHLNVKDFGAVGDGVADDTQAINTLINSIDEGTIYFPGGTYLLSRQGTRELPFSGEQRGYGLLLLDKTGVKLSFAHNAKIVMSVVDADLFNAIWVEGCSDIEIENARFIGTGTGATRILEEGTGISITESEKIRVRNPKSQNIRGCARAYHSKDVVIEGGFSSTLRTGQPTGHFALYSCQDSEIRYCKSYGVTQDGDIFIYGGNSINCNIICCKAYAYEYLDASKTIFFDAGHGILVDSGGKNCKILDCYCYGYYYGFDAKNDSEGTVIDGCTAEKCKIGISARKGDSVASPVNVVTISNNTIVPDGGNGNKVPLLGDITFDFGIYLSDVYGAANVTGNKIYNSVTSSAESDAFDFYGVVVSLSENVGESYQGGINIHDNIFLNENRSGARFGVNRRSSIFVVSPNRIRNVSIQGNYFDFYQGGLLETAISINGVDGLDIKNNTFGDIKGTAPYAITVINSERVNVDSNHFGTHFGIGNFNTCTQVSFSDNTNLRPLNGSTVTLLFNSCNFIKINSNTQRDGVSVTEAVYYYTVVDAVSNNVIMTGNLLQMHGKTSTDWYSIQAANSLVQNNLIV